MIKKDRLRLTLVLVMLGLLTVFCADFSGGESPADPITALLSEFSGKVQVMKASKGVFEAASPDFFLEVNDQVLTGEDGRARIDISDGTIIRLSPLSNFVLTAMEDTDEGTLTRLQLNIGRLWIILKGGVVEVDTPSGLASVRGSYLHVWVDPLTEETNVTCLEGHCQLGNGEGTVSLVAGQTAMIRGTGRAPEAGDMTDGDVSAWLDENPEATLVVVPLTKTVEANQGKPTPEAKTNTPTPTNTIGPSPTTGPTKTPTNTVEAAGCGPPEGWVLHTIRQGETMESLAALYRVSEDDLRNANCRGEMDFVVPGEKFYVPNVATSTPTNTATPTPLATKTPTPDGGGGGGGTSDSPTTMSNPVGPANKVIPVDVTCANSYRIKVTDADGLAFVKMIYTLDGSLPDLDNAKLVGLTLLTDDVYSISSYTIDTTAKTPPVEIHWRFAAKDSNGNVTYYPADSDYFLTDKTSCLNDTPATLSNESGPINPITDVYSCSNTYNVDVVDPDGISWVKLVYSTDGSLPTFGASGTDWFLMPKTTGDTFEVTEVIDVTASPPVTVNYRFATSDSYGHIIHYPATALSFSDTIGCGETTWVTPISPDSLILSAIADCDQTYQIDVSDANGISEVKVKFTITDAAATVPTDTFYKLLTLDSGDAISGTWKLVTSIDLATDGFATGSTVDFEFWAYDLRGDSVLMYSGSYTDDYVCGP